MIRYVHGYMLRYVLCTWIENKVSTWIYDKVCTWIDNKVSTWIYDKVCTMYMDRK